MKFANSIAVGHSNNVLAHLKVVNQFKHNKYILRNVNYMYTFKNDFCWALYYSLMLALYWPHVGLMIAI